uniref:Succinate:cytochrome c oxidoreductase subunit 4 n=2 Tax=Roya TaxID=43942 RepID=A0A6G9IES0_9VIRI|nr:succinate:cytochrome c oxidoreductase subunit 4 [Roya obtusa]YP_009755721.1 succinate:cytochrome c oxidoreductase subunit 4 [Roya anglica]AGZ90397.1 succinate:cytochrome c oxidoreductase subunit 4 [Roya obtusa]QIQ22960.1 succinate:cytochrome c oxidoreductase subunit 4 [Roya anglica]
MFFKKEILTHWLIQRFITIFLLILTLVANVPILIYFNIFVFLHIYIGLEEIFLDYLHDKFTQKFLLLLIKILILVLIKYMFVLFLF